MCRREVHRAAGRQPEDPRDPHGAAGEEHGGEADPERRGAERDARRLETEDAGGHRPEGADQDEDLGDERGDRRADRAVGGAQVERRDEDEVQRWIQNAGGADDGEPHAFASGGHQHAGQQVVDEDQSDREGLHAKDRDRGRVRAEGEEETDDLLRQDEERDRDRHREDEKEVQRLADRDLEFARRLHPQPREHREHRDEQHHRHEVAGLHQPRRRRVPPDGRLSGEPAQDRDVDLRHEQPERLRREEREATPKQNVDCRRPLP